MKTDDLSLKLKLNGTYYWTLSNHVEEKNVVKFDLSPFQPVMRKH